MLLALVKVSALLKVVWGSAAAGVGITLLFSIAVYASIRSGETRRARGSFAALPFMALAGVGYAAVTAAVVIGLLLMTKK
jgi:hypothetical protein